MNKGMKIFKTIVIILLVMVLGVVSYGAITMYQGFKQAENPSPVSELPVFKGEQAEEGKVNIMLVGSDARSNDELGRADTLMIAQYDKKTKVPKLISIMRDCYVDIPGYGEDKINAAYSYGGPELMRETLKANFDLPIEYYAALTFSEFTDLINELFPKGVEIDAEKDIELDGVSIKNGNQRMDGNTLLQYVRFRKDEESDFGRVRRQDQAIGELSKQAVDVANIARLPKVLGLSLGYLDTNLTATSIMSIASDFVLGQQKDLQSLAIPMEDTWEFDDNTESGSVIRLDFQANSDEMHRFLGQKVEEEP